MRVSQALQSHVTLPWWPLLLGNRDENALGWECFAVKQVFNPSTVNVSPPETLPCPQLFKLLSRRCVYLIKEVYNPVEERLHLHQFSIFCVLWKYVNHDSICGTNNLSRTILAWWTKGLVQYKYLHHVHLVKSNFCTAFMSPEFPGMIQAVTMH